MAIPKAPVNRIIKDAGAERVSDAAVVALVEYLEADAAAVAKKAIEYAKIAKRQTVKADKFYFIFLLFFYIFYYF